MRRTCLRSCTIPVRRNADTMLTPPQRLAWQNIAELVGVIRYDATRVVVFVEAL
jgi:hypothetical protein